MSRKSQSNNELRAARPQSKSRLGLASKMLASASALGYLSPEVPSNPPQMMPPNFGSVNPTSKTQTKKVLLLITRNNSYISYMIIKSRIL